MKKLISICIGLFIVIAVVCTPVPTEAKKITSSLQELIQTLQAQIEALRTQILGLQIELQSIEEAEGEVKEAVEEIKSTLKLTRQLWRGATGEDVTLLQEVLATDPEIYPEGLITGYFGPLTEKAVKQFQQKMGVEQVGRVGPKTVSKINELLEEGAGSSGKVPPGLLIAPGIKKKLGYSPTVPADQELPPGIAKKLNGTTSTEPDDDATSTPDIVAPVISDLTATDTTATATSIVWTTDEEADSMAWYDIVSPLVISISTLNVSSSDLDTDHELLIGDLIASTTYYYLVTSDDNDNNRATSTEESFTTLSE